jgi:hypothetical protein
MTSPLTRKLLRTDGASAGKPINGKASEATVSTVKVAITDMTFAGKGSTGPPQSGEPVAREEIRGLLLCFARLRFIQPLTTFFSCRKEAAVKAG